MTRTPPALTTLIRQVSERDEDAAIELRDVDGYGRARTAVFGDATSEWLAPIVEAMVDKRISAWEVDDEGVLYVTVVSNRQADDKSDFPLGPVEKVLHEDEAPSDLITYEGRNAELRELKAGQLREQFPGYADLPNKDAIIEAILADEFY